MDENLNRLVNAEIGRFYNNLGKTPIGVSASCEELRASICDALPEQGESPEQALKHLIEGVEKGLLHTVSPRFFGYVIGGAKPVSIAADWLTSAWDQCGHVYQTSPANAVVEEIVSKWLLDLLDLPEDASIGFVTGAQMANFVGLSVGKNAVLAKHGWEVDKKGLQNAPHLTIISAECCHGTIKSAIRMMGLGADNILSIPCDDQGRMDVQLLKSEIGQIEGPAILCLQAGNVNTGSFDQFEDIIELAHTRDIWVHVDGAFGLWARASVSLKHLTTGVESADSWSIDAHKWLNTPVDSGMIIIREPEEHKRLKINRCAYAGMQSEQSRDGSELVPENSRRARAFVLYATLRELGREGVDALVRQSCNLARRFATGLAKRPDITLLNDVVLNQVVFRVDTPANIDPTQFHNAIAGHIQKSGICWLGTTEWKDLAALRISVSNYATQESDVDITLRGINEAINAQTSHANSSV